jgi:Cu(I)/Ag(I) efflux system periplasmic protein CusF
MKNLKSLAITSALLLSSTSVFAASYPGVAVVKDSAKTEAAVSSPTDMADGEIRKIDKENKKLTLKHGPIKSLDMPSMTMVFQIKDAAMLDNFKTGDKIKFKVEQTGNATVVTEIQPVK